MCRLQNVKSISHQNTPQHLVMQNKHKPKERSTKTLRVWLTWRSIILQDLLGEVRREWKKPMRSHNLPKLKFCQKTWMISTWLANSLRHKSWWKLWKSATTPGIVVTKCGPNLLHKSHTNTIFVLCSRNVRPQEVAVSWSTTKLGKKRSVCRTSCFSTNSMQTWI